MEYFGTDLYHHGHYRWQMKDISLTEYSLKFNDLPFNPEELTKNLRKGSIIFYQGGDFTVLGIAGSIVDDRPGTKSVFWVRQIISREQIIDQILSIPIGKEIIERLQSKYPFELK